MEVKNSGLDTSLRKFRVSNKVPACLHVAGNVQTCSLCAPPSSPTGTPLLLPILLIVGLSNRLFERGILPIKSNKLENYSLGTKILSYR